MPSPLSPLLDLFHSPLLRPSDPRPLGRSSRDRDCLLPTVLASLLERGESERKKKKTKSSINHIFISLLPLALFLHLSPVHGVREEDEYEKRKRSMRMKRRRKGVVVGVGGELGERGGGGSRMILTRHCRDLSLSLSLSPSLSLSQSQYIHPPSSTPPIDASAASSPPSPDAPSAPTRPRPRNHRLSSIVVGFSNVNRCPGNLLSAVTASVDEGGHTVDILCSSESRNFTVDDCVLSPSLVADHQADHRRWFGNSVPRLYKSKQKGARGGGAGIFADARHVSGSLLPPLHRRATTSDDVGWAVGQFSCDWLSFSLVSVYAHVHSRSPTEGDSRWSSHLQRTIHTLLLSSPLVVVGGDINCGPDHSSEAKKRVYAGCCEVLQAAANLSSVSLSTLHTPSPTHGGNTLDHVGILHVPLADHGISFSPPFTIPTTSDHLMVTVSIAQSSRSGRLPLIVRAPHRLVGTPRYDLLIGADPGILQRLFIREVGFSIEDSLKGAQEQGCPLSLEAFAVAVHDGAVPALMVRLPPPPSWSPVRPSRSSDSRRRRLPSPW